MQAAILRARLPLLPAWTARRRELAARYRARSRAAPVVVPPECDPGHVYHLFAVRSTERAAAFRRTRARAASRRSSTTRFRFPASRRSRARIPAACPVADSRLRRSLFAPAPSGLSDDDVDAVAEAVVGV